MSYLDRDVDHTASELAIDQTRRTHDGTVLSARVVATGLGFPEAPCALADGSVLVAELARGRVSRVDVVDGAVSPVADLGGSPNGIALGPEGAAYVCNNGGLRFEESGGRHYPRGLSADYAGGYVQRLDLESGRWEVLHREFQGRPLVGPNDIVFDAAGRYWFTDQPRKHEHHRDWGSVYRSSARGGLDRVISRLDDPNGIGVSPDASRLYVAETNSGRLWAWGLQRDGELSPLYAGDLAYLNQGAELVGRTSEFRYFDSLAVTASGDVVVATLGEPGGLTVFEATTGAQRFVTLEGPGVPAETFVTNLCFGGPDLRTAFITFSTAGLLVAADWPAEGHRLPHSRPRLQGLGASHPQPSGLDKKADS